MQRDIRVAACQFEARDGAKAHNLEQIARLTKLSVEKGAEVVVFHECCCTGYTFLQTLSSAALLALAEPIPGPTTSALCEIARSSGAAVCAGLLEVDAGGSVYNSYVACEGEGVVARHRKLHPFVHPDLQPGQGFTLCTLRGVCFGFLTCYDNIIPENVRATALLGAAVIVMPHVTGCVASSMPGRGPVDPALWANRDRDPAALRREFDGLKAREWLMRWLPARCWENGVFAVYSNNVGMDGDTVKPGGACLLDPCGEVLDECRALGEGIAVALLVGERHATAPGRRYERSRRPELYGRLCEPLPQGLAPVTRPGWLRAFDAGGAEKK